MGLLSLCTIAFIITLPSLLHYVSESRGRIDLEYLGREQQNYFLNNLKFAGSLTELKSNFKQSKLSTGREHELLEQIANHPIYNYTIELIPGEKQMVVATAIPKSNYQKYLRSFVMLQQSSDQGAKGRTKIIICKTPKSTIPPVTFDNAPGPLACPGTLIPVSS